MKTHLSRIPRTGVDQSFMNIVSILNDAELGKLFFDERGGQYKGRILECLLINEKKGVELRRSDISDEIGANQHSDLEELERDGLISRSQGPGNQLITVGPNLVEFIKDRLPKTDILQNLQSSLKALIVKGR